MIPYDQIKSLHKDTTAPFVSCKHALETHETYDLAKKAILDFQKGLEKKSSWNRHELQNLPEWKLHIVTGRQLR